MKKTGVFYTKDILERVKQNKENYSWAQDICKRLEQEAEPWLRQSDDELWTLVFGNTIPRSWMVWSNGYCPSCKNDVPMYSWVIDPFKHPWKVQCPHCMELFPKNDFNRYYVSGLDSSGIFQYELADSLLLFNAEHPDKGDPLHKFGVDDGYGYKDPESESCWRFIGAYLIYGQWKKLIVTGIEKLANAFVASGQNKYARKAGILLDRVADVYPDFDFGEQGILYEKKALAGYVSTWHDACLETKDMAVSYDKVFDALKHDEEFVRFLSKKAGEIGLVNKKLNFSDIQMNIEDRILKDAVSNRQKINLNFPGADTAIIIMKTILDWPDSKNEIIKEIDRIIELSTAVDGLTGEKGLSNYSALTVNKLAEFLILYDLADQKLLESIIVRHPALKRTYRFFIDTWCLENYYPLTGDAGSFAEPVKYYRGVKFENQPAISMNFEKDLGADPSMYTFIWKLYKITGDSDYLKIIYKSNNNNVAMLPYDITSVNPQEMQYDVAGIISREGAGLKLGSVNMEQWHLAILRSGSGTNERAVWLDYDSGFPHGHNDGMNLGLFAKGLDLMPDFGYVPVQYGGWSTPQVRWYRSTAAHNTVVVDRKNDNRNVGGITKLWLDCEILKAISVSAPQLIEGERFERTIALVNVSEEDSYILDIFRVEGGREHSKFMHSHFGEITCRGFSPETAYEYEGDMLMRNFFADDNPQPNWSVDWNIEDKYMLLPDKREIHLKYTDLTDDTKVCIAEGWISAGGFGKKCESWIPRLIVNRGSDIDTLKSCFVGIIEPYDKNSNIREINRLKLENSLGDKYLADDTAVEVILNNGRRDLIAVPDAEYYTMHSSKESRISFSQKKWDMEFDGKFCFVSAGDYGVEKIILTKANWVKVSGLYIGFKSEVELFEASFKDRSLQLIKGDRELIETFYYS